ncbi:hypothetical protein EL18_02056 [Nitratireductor basaltis]|uniref:Uncharacterized protein n=1 Tax=Nitratireductor basaltis TaxID=472175 RepID=A0A084UDH8_9HYPH|nr:hypothetical protein EL18_02056 [Nitratireductor basaltis]
MRFAGLTENAYGYVIIAVILAAIGLGIWEWLMK